MKRIIFGSTRNELIQDMKIGLVLDNYDEDYELRLVTSPDDIAREVADSRPDLIVLDYSMLSMRDAWKFDDIPVAYSAKDREELNLGSVYGIKTIGIASSASDILNKLRKEPYDIERHDISKTGHGHQTHAVPEKNADAAVKTENSKNPPERNTEGLEELEELEDVDDFDDLFDLDISSGAEAETPEEPDTGWADDEQPDSGKEPMQRKNAKPTEDDVIEQEFRKDISPNKGKTKVVTVYSAKGGVGKTTIATELAVYLSLVSAGRDKLRVCLIDYNIDFGDVKGTLALKDEGPNLTYWADEVQEYLSKGKKPEEIVYDRNGIEEWLRIYKDTGLYVLPAPLTNEDSMGIETEALDIILTNLIRNGEFDFIVCDTGNNTRDSTMIALEHADTILLVMTQNVNTAFCDKAFLETMKSIDFDMSNTKLVINYIMPKKSTGISVQEIVEFFPYECVGKLRFNTDVITATNLGLPLAVNEPDSDFISQMRSIVAFLLKGSEFEVNKKPKKRLFGFLGKR